jgi:hypothetical protein
MTNPSGLGGIFPGSLYMNTDPPNTGTGAGHIPPPPPPPQIPTYCTGKPRINLRKSTAYQKTKQETKKKRTNRKKTLQPTQARNNTNKKNNINNINDQLALMVFDQKNLRISDHKKQL